MNTPAQNPNAQSTQNQEAAEKLSAFLSQSPSPYHAVESCSKELSDFCELDEADSWQELTKAKAGQGFFCRRGGSLIAWVCGSAPPWESGSGLHLAAAHTDSPTFKLKLESAHFEYGVLAAHIAVYGSPIFATYFDRSLGVAGIAVRSDGSQNQMRLIHQQEPIAIIPNLAIHLNREANTKLCYNAQNQIQAIFGQEDTLTQRDNAQSDDAPSLLRKELGLHEDEVAELQLCSTQRPELLGLGANKDLFSGSRLDDISMVYLLLQAIRKEVGKKERSFWPVVLFCNGEEVGSRTYEGAASNFANSVLQRIVQVSSQASDPSSNPSSNQASSSEAWARTRARSFLLSLDGAHASHPSYPEAFDPSYHLNMGAGPAIKLPYGSNGASYSSEPHSVAKIKAIAKSASCPLQITAPRSDKPSGSTIGPILSSQLGMRGVDIGLPMYAMHSIQESISIADYLHLQKLVSQYFQ